VLSLSSASGTATVAQWQAALRAVTFTSLSEEPSTAGRTISFTVNDGTADSNVGAKSLSVAAYNDPPSGADDTIAISEDVPHVFAREDFGFADVDGDAS
jgi:hypothetical protein